MRRIARQSPLICNCLGLLQLLKHIHQGLAQFFALDQLHCLLVPNPFSISNGGFRPTLEDPFHLHGKDCKLAAILLEGYGFFANLANCPGFLVSLKPCSLKGSKLLLYIALGDQPGLARCTGDDQHLKSAILDFKGNNACFFLHFQLNPQFLILPFENRNLTPGINVLLLNTRWLPVKQ